MHPEYNRFDPNNLDPNDLDPNSFDPNNPDPGRSGSDMFDMSRFDKFIAFLRAALRVLSIAVAVFGALVLIRSLVNAAFLRGYDSGSYSIAAEYTAHKLTQIPISIAMS